jgi:hypothetical protein
LPAEQLAGFCGPGQQLAVEDDPVRAQFVPDPGCTEPVSDLGEEILLVTGGGEKGPAGAGEDGAGGAVGDGEAAGSHVGVLADDDHGPGAHVLLLADHLRDAIAGVVGERLVGVFELPGAGGGGRRGHGRRQIDQPAGIRGEATHHLQSSHGVLLPDRHGPTGEAGRDDLLAEDVADVEVGRLAVAVDRIVGLANRPGGLPVRLASGDGDELSLGPA